MKTEIKLDGLTVTFNETPELKEAVYQKVLAFFKEQECFAGESFSQCDSPQIAVMELMPELLDEHFKFECNYE